MNEADKTADFHYQLDPANRKLRYTDADGKSHTLNFKINEKDSLLILQKDHHCITLKKLNWQKMPALQARFHQRVQ